MEPVDQTKFCAGPLEGIAAVELQRRRWGETELAGRAKGDAQKVALAQRLRAETTVTVKQIAERLHMGAPGDVNHLLYRRRKAEAPRYTNIKN